MSRVHPLHDPEVLAMHMAMTGHYPDTSRGTGRTEALALELVVKAMRNPYIWMAATDHASSKHTDAYLLHRCERIVMQCGYKHFYFDYPNAMVCFGCPPKER